MEEISEVKEVQGATFFTLCSKKSSGRFKAWRIRKKFTGLADLFWATRLPR